MILSPFSSISTKIRNFNDNLLEEGRFPPCHTSNTIESPHVKITFWSFMLTKVFANGRTLLSSACVYKKWNLARHLLMSLVMYTKRKHVIKVLHSNHGSEGCPLHICCKYEAPVELIRDLVSAGSDVNAPTPWDQTPLLLARNPKTASTLIHLGATTGRHPNYPLVHFRNHEGILHVLLGHGNSPGGSREALESGVTNANCARLIASVLKMSHPFLLKHKQFLAYLKSVNSEEVYDAIVSEFGSELST